jgi:hypothetical protein
MAGGPWLGYAGPRTRLCALGRWATRKNDRGDGWADFDGDARFWPIAGLGIEELF